MNGKHLAPTRSQGVLRVSHPAANIEHRFHVILPGGSWLNPFLANAQRAIGFQGLGRSEDSAPIADDPFGDACRCEGLKEDFQVVPLILGKRELTCQDAAGVVFQNRELVDGTGVASQ